MEIRERVPTLVPERELIPQEGLPRLAAAALPAALALFECAFLFQEVRVRGLSPEFPSGQNRTMGEEPVREQAGLWSATGFPSLAVMMTEKEETMLSWTRMHLRLSASHHLILR